MAVVDTEGCRVSNDRISELLAQFTQARAQMLEQLRKVVVGQSDVIGSTKSLPISSIRQILDDDASIRFTRPRSWVSAPMD